MPSLDERISAAWANNTSEQLNETAIERTARIAGVGHAAVVDWLHGPVSRPLPSPNSVGWWALKDGEYVEFVESDKFDTPTEACAHFFDNHGQGVVFHHGNRAGLRMTPA